MIPITIIVRLNNAAEGTLPIFIVYLKKLNLIKLRRLLKLF